jgi:D-xylose transport system ATP-binding protein
MEQMAGDTLASLSVRTVKSLRQLVASLSGGQRQTVAIARSVLWNSKLVILDEPTAALGVAQTEQVLRLVRRLADRGLAVVLISHNLNDVFAVADRVSVLYLGRMAAQVKTKDVTSNQVVELITTSRSGSIGLSTDVEPDAEELQEGIAEDAAAEGETVSTPPAGTRKDTP